MSRWSSGVVEGGRLTEKPFYSILITTDPFLVDLACPLFAININLAPQFNAELWKRGQESPWLWVRITITLPWVFMIQAALPVWYKKRQSRIVEALCAEINAMPGGSLWPGGVEGDEDQQGVHSES